MSETIDLDKALEAAPTTAPGTGRQLSKWERAIEASRGRFDTIADKALVNYDRESLFAMQHLIKSDYAMKVAEGNPKSVILAMANVAATGLSLNPAYGLAYLVPRDGAIKLDISYKGLLQIATDSGSIMWGRADVVREADDFEYCGPAAAPIHKAKVFAKDRGEIVGAYVIAKTNTGDILCGIMTRDELDTVRSKSDAWTRAKPGQSRGPWESFPEEMCKKAVIKRDQKTWPRTDQHKRLAEAVEIANEAEGGYTFESSAEAVPQQLIGDERKQRCDDAAEQYEEAVKAVKVAIYKAHDGMNIAAKREQVTCKLCLSLLAKKGVKDNRDKPTSAEEVAAVANLRRSIGYTPVEVINMSRRDREEEARAEGVWGYPMEWDNDN